MRLRLINHTHPVFRIPFKFNNLTPVANLQPLSLNPLPPGRAICQYPESEAPRSTKPAAPASRHHLLISNCIALIPTAGPSDMIARTQGRPINAATAGAARLVFLRPTQEVMS
ncbi:MAG: hypothetical protein ACE5EU_10140, partial [Paracoccaceae bacterium]